MNTLSENIRLDASLRFLMRDGEMRSRIKEFDWKNTALGELAGWPTSLKTALSLMLDSATPAYIAWGPEHYQFYNDAYIPILGPEKHQDAIGKTTPETWGEIWDFVGPLFASVVQSGQAIRKENYLFPMLRNGYLEECFFSFSYSPLTSEEGTVNGIYATVWETTEEYVSNRRKNVLRLLTQRFARADDVAEIHAAFVKKINECSEDLPFGLWYERRPDSSGFELVAAAGINAGSALAPPFIAPQDPGFYAGLMRPNQLDRHDCALDEALVRSSCAENLSRIPVRLMIEPVVYGERQQPDAYIVLGANPMRPYDEAQKEFLQSVVLNVENTMRRIKRLLLDRTEQAYQFQTVMSALPCLVWLSDTEQKCTFVNQAWIEFTGRSLDEALNDGWESLVHPDDLEKIRRYRVERLKRPTGETCEFRLMSATNTYRWVVNKAVPRYDINGNLLGEIGTAVDITERKQALLESVRINRTLSLLNRCNQMVTEAENAHQLLHAICRLVAETGGYNAAWAGCIEENNDIITPVAWSGISEEAAFAAGMSMRNKSAPARQNFVAQTMHNGRASVTGDLVQSSTFFMSHEGTSEDGCHSGICLPLRSGVRNLGVLAIYSQEATSIVAEEMRLIEELANKVAFGIESCRYREQQRKTEAAIAHIAASASVNTDVYFFEQLVRSLTIALDAQIGVLAQVLPGAPLRARTIAVVIDGQVRENFEYLIEGSPCEKFIGETSWIFEDRLAERFPNALIPAEFGARAAVGRRLNNAAGQLMGVLFVLFRNPINQQHALIRSTLQIFAERATGELRRRNSEQEILSSKNELRRLYDLLHKTREEERRALAREVHDQLGQVLSAAKIDIKLLQKNISAKKRIAPEEMLGELKSAEKAVEKAIEIVRRLAYELRPPELETQGLVTAIQWHLRDFERRTKILCHVDMPATMPTLNHEVTLALFGIFQEALTNVLRHAQATRVWISLVWEDRRLCFSIRDDGIGIERVQLQDVRTLGLKGMQERATSIGGVLQVSTAQPTGTLITVKVQRGRETNVLEAMHAGS